VREQIVATDPQQADAAYVARLLLGAQTEHEQRLTAARLLRRDERFRAAVAAVLEPFEMFDADLAAEYGKALRQARPGVELAARRLRILERAFARAPDLEQMLREFTYNDVLRLGQVTRRIFTWSMAELLLQRAGRPGLSDYEVKVSLYLAQMVVDAVEILCAAGHSPEVPEVVADVRQRIAEMIAR
jgi:hypothetical protein